MLIGIVNSKTYKMLLKGNVNHTVNSQSDDNLEISIILSVKNELLSYVQSIIHEQKQKPRYDYASNEQIEIDRLVCKAYGLNKDDIQEVENWYARRYPKLAAAQKANLEAKQKAEQK